MLEMTQVRAEKKMSRTVASRMRLEKVSAGPESMILRANPKGIMTSHTKVMKRRTFMNGKTGLESIPVVTTHRCHKKELT